MSPGASCAPVETSMADDLRAVIDEMKLLRSLPHTDKPLKLHLPQASGTRRGHQFSCGDAGGQEPGV